jgi:hypothetical protein
MAKKKKNRNIVLLKGIDDLQNEVNYSDFEFKEHFFHLCDIIPNKEKEKLELDISTVCAEKIKIAGLVYVFVINGKIFKIGHSITPISKRVQSYNCGKTEYRISGTNSTTNYFVLQSLLNINQTVNVYAYFPEHQAYTVFGKTYTDSFPPAKRAENDVITSFLKKHNKKPIGCTQT